jgi:AmpD protein|tara:strand:- start:287 stop:829 length:543 start_codon:yes stop_codon:yes gene_type:complete
MQIENGWLSCATQMPSPNTDQRPQVADISLLVIHNISLPPNQFGGGHIGEFFSNRLDPEADAYFAEICHLKVSSHLLIDRQGLITQFAGFNQRAWHAGVSQFEERYGCNDFSIGIEMEGADHIPYTEVQYQELAKVSVALLEAYPLLTIDRIVGHSDIAPGRKTDPGRAFQWDHYKKLLG